MKLSIRLGLLVLILFSACTPSVKSQALPSLTPSLTSPSTATVAASIQTVIPSPAAPTATGTVSTVQPSPTALLLPTQVEKENPTPTPGPPTPSVSATTTPNPSLLDQYLPRRKKVAETQHFIFYAQDGYWPIDQTWWTAEAEILYTYVSLRVQAQAKNKISLAFLPPETRSCPVRGLASEDGSPMVIIYADANSTRSYLEAVLSHELGHAIPSEGFQGGLPDSLALTEGLATWASGKYWDTWKNVPSLDELIRQYIRQGQYEPIHENVDLHGIYPWQNPSGSSQDCLARRDKVYSEWADFLGYLIDTYGWEKALRLFRNPPPVHQNGQVIIFPSDYQGIYGKALNQLEWEWLQWLQKRHSF